MRKYLDIDLGTRTVTTREFEGDSLVNAGRYFIAKSLVECGAASVDPEDALTVVTGEGTERRIKVEDVPEGRRAGKGRRVVKHRRL